jgi:TonB family protein
MKGDDAGAYVSRAAAYAGRDRYDLALGDLNKAIEIDPKRVETWLNRGTAHEKLGNTQKAAEDYSKALDLDAANEPAKTALQRLQAQAKTELPKPAPTIAEPKTALPQPGPATTAATTPEFLNIGPISSSSARLATPIYPVAARQMNIQGKVTVQVTFDEEGKVISAKATSGPNALRGVSEEAARRSKFTPVKIGDKVVKGMGYIVYNFVN